MEMKNLNVIYENADQKNVRAVVVYTNPEESTIKFLYTDETYAEKVHPDVLVELFTKKLLLVKYDNEFAYPVTLSTADPELYSVGFYATNGVLMHGLAAPKATA